MTLQKQIDELLAQRASQWVDALRHGSVDSAADFVAWVGESPRNLDEVLTMAALDRELENRELYRSIDRDALLRQVTKPVARLQRPQRLVSVQPERNAPTSRSRESRRHANWRIVTLAACIAILGTLGILTAYSLLGSQEYVTGIGEQRSLELADGSLVYLNARSAVKLRFDETARAVDLIEGDALFRVARDPQRPFEVHTRDAVVKALGTQFNVSSRTSGTKVAVLEGRVEVSTPESRAPTKAALSVGEAAQIARKGRSVQVTARADVANDAAWRERRLVFVQAPLEDIVEEFNRFNRKGMRLDGVQPGARHYSGTFDADDAAALIAFLSREPDLSIEQTADEIVIRER